MLTRLIFIFIFSCVSLSSFAEIKIRLFYAEKASILLIRVPDSTYSLQYNTGNIEALLKGEMILISRAGERVAVSRLNGHSIIADSLSLRTLSTFSFLTLSLPGNRNKIADYQGDFVISSSLGTLKIVNHIAMEPYIAGVVQAEGGYKGHPEFFKTQAVIARTYAYLHINRHADEGYDLCDDVHCQAYHGRSITDAINIAVSKTKNMVITDSDSLLILTPFHSNCGGQTVSSGDVWLISLPYLQSITDPYCAFSHNALWEKRISKEEWLSYLNKNGIEGISPDTKIEFVQNARLKDYSIDGNTLSLRQIRDDFGFRSSFFSIREEGSGLKFSGRGYGHGVGLCQEGAMVMATRGFRYDQIINFYYQSVMIMDIESVNMPEKKELSF